MSSPYSIPQSVVNNNREEISEQLLTVYPFNPEDPYAKSNCNSIALPDGLQGYYFVVAALSEPEEYILNGDGMIYRLGFEQGQAKLTTRLMKTPCYYADRATQQKQYPLTFKFKNGGPSRMSPALGNRNQLNTAFLRVGDRLFVTFDAGRPWEIDPQSLELLEPLGSKAEWSSIVPNLDLNIFPPHSNPAHPVCDLDADTSPCGIFTINYSTGYKGKFRNLVDRLLNWVIQKLKFENIRIYGGFTDLIYYDLNNPEHPLKRWRLLLPSLPELNKQQWRSFFSPIFCDDRWVVAEQSIHQIAMSRDYIVFADIAFKIEFTQIFYPFLFGWLDWLEKWLATPGNLMQPVLGRFQRGIGDLIDETSERFFATRLGAWIYSVFLQLIQPSPVTDFYIIARRDIATAEKEIMVKQVKIPRETSHFAIDYDNPDGKIILYIGHNNGSDPTEWINRYDLPVVGKEKLFRGRNMAGMIVGAADLGSFGRYIIDGRTGTLLDSRVISDARHTWNPTVYTHLGEQSNDVSQIATLKDMYWITWGFSWELVPDRIYQAYKMRSFRAMPVEELHYQANKPITLLRVDTEKMEIADYFEFPSGFFACSPQFIPIVSDSGSPDSGSNSSPQGYIVCVVLSDDPHDPTQIRDEFWVFHADNLREKPIYRICASKASTAAKSLNIGLTIHSVWLPTLKSIPAEERHTRRDIAFCRDYGNLLNHRNARIRHLFLKVIYPNFKAQTLEQNFDHVMRSRSK